MEARNLALFSQPCTFSVQGKSHSAHLYKAWRKALNATQVIANPQKHISSKILHPDMANYRVWPPITNSRPLITETVLPPKDPVLHGGLVQNFTIDPNLKQSHELDHETYNPLPAPHAPVNIKGSQMMLKPNPNRLSLSSNESALSKQIAATHTSGYEEFDVKPVLAIVEDIFLLAKPFTTTTTDHSIAPIHGNQIQHHFDTKEDNAYHSSTLDDKRYHIPTLDDKAYDNSYRDLDIVKALAFPINKICSEIVCKCAAGAEAHSVTMDFLKTLSNYPWDAKVVIVFAAFSINYGEFWLVVQHQTKDPLAKNIASLKDLPETMQQSTDLRKKFESVFELLSTALKVTHCLIEFKELPSQYISHESGEMAAATAHIPSAVYWIIRSLLVCASLLLNLIGSGHEYLTSTAESWEILNMAHKLSVMLEHLQTQLKICKDLIERKRGEDAYIAFKKLMEAVHIDNMKVLRAMFRAREDQKPLFHGYRKTNEKLEVLRSKHVLLLITDLNIPHEELNILHSIYNQHPTRQEYEVLWLPIAESSMVSFQDTDFHNLRNSMPWHSVEQPSFIEPVAIRYIREVWNFVHRPMLVVLDPQGKPSNIDALPMMWIWRSNGFPFTKQREMALWVESTWNLELLADAIDPRFADWIRDNKVICLYGGEDIEWIRRFAQSTRTAANTLRIQLEMLYVGKRNPKEKVRRCHEVIERENLSQIFSRDNYNDYIWFFWTRLMSMLNSKKQLGTSLESDVVMQEILNMLTFDGSETGWAVFSRGNNEMTKGEGQVLLDVMNNHTQWALRIENADMFVRILDEELRGVHTEHHCNRLILPGYAGSITERIVCSECGKTMDQYVMYRCCTD